METARKQQLLVVILLALIIHLIFLMPLLLKFFGPEIDLKKRAEEKQPIELFQQAALKPKEALILPDYQPPVLPQPPQPEQEQVEQAEEQEQLETKAPEEPAIQPNLKPSLEPVPEHLPYSDLPGLIEKLKEIKDDPSTRPSELDQGDRIKSKETEPEKKQPEVEQKPTETKKVRKLPRVIQPPQNRPTLPNFNQNFAQYMKEGEDDFKRNGNENIRPDLEELRLLSYHKKIIQFLNGASGQLRRKINTVLKTCKAKRDLKLAFSINKSGQLIETEIIQTCGDQEVDELFKEMFKLASPFPNPPTHMNGKFTQQCSVSKHVMEYAKNGETSFIFHMYD